jgi:hypothetical protein
LEVRGSVIQLLVVRGSVTRLLEVAEVRGRMTWLLVVRGSVTLLVVILLESMTTIARRLMMMTVMAGPLAVREGWTQMTLMEIIAAMTKTLLLVMMIAEEMIVYI